MMDIMIRTFERLIKTFPHRTANQRVQFGKIAFALALSIACPFLTHSDAAASLQTGTQIWSLNTARFAIDQDRKWEAYLELQPRFDTSAPNRGRILFRPGIWYNIDSRQNLMLGVLDLTDIEFNFKEFRIWEQYQRSDALEFTSAPTLTLVNRTRLEQRFLQGSSDLGLRLRHMLRAQQPIHAGSPWSWVVFDELFIGINHNTSQPSPGFDQNRVFAGIRRDFAGGHVGVEFGYLNQLLRGSMIHAPLLFLSIR
jgi:hypothetical protein